MLKYILQFIIVIVVHSWTQEVDFSIHGKGWSQFGKIIKSSDTSQTNFNGNWIQSNGVQFTAIAQIGKNLEGAFGFGGQQTHNSMGLPIETKFAGFGFENFITQSRITYFLGEKNQPNFSLTFGNFAYNYHPDIKNLGLYLTRGTVYPGFLESGFEDARIDTTRGNVLGMKIHHQYGSFQHQLLLMNERKYAPSFDWHLAYLAKIKIGTSLTLGAGMNSYRILKQNKDLTELSITEQRLTENPTQDQHPYQAYYYDTEWKDTNNDGISDTLIVTHQYTHAGTKLMGMWSFDPKPLFGMSEAKEDYKIYGEVGLIGIKNQGKVYSKISERIPIMVGINLPTFGFLDVLSFEVEYYRAKYKNDTRKIDYQGVKPTQFPSPVPISYANYYQNNSFYLYTDSVVVKDPQTELLVTSYTDSVLAARIRGDTVVIQGKNNPFDIQNLTSDDFKWSLYGKKTIAKHIFISGQIANDHYRPAPVRESPFTVREGSQTAFSHIWDWYYMFKVGYLF